MGINPRSSYEERKQPQQVPYIDRLKPKTSGAATSGLIVGIIGALVLLAVLIYFLPRTPRSAQIRPQPVPGKLQLHGVQLIAGPTDNSFYLDGLITSTGSRSITSVLADVKMRNWQENVVFDVRRPMEGISDLRSALVPDPFTKDPIKPNDTRPFRLSVQQAPHSWNGNVPEVLVVAVTGTTGG